MSDKEKELGVAPATPSENKENEEVSMIVTFKKPYIFDKEEYKEF